MRRSAAMEVRRGRGGEPREPLWDGLSLGISEKLRAKPWFGSCACEGRGEHGMTGLGNSIGDVVGDSDGGGEGSE
jgi:hypothetical protein